MKNKIWIAVIGLTLALAFAMPSLAQTTAVVVDGKTYIFEGEATTYEADGKMFQIQDDTVCVLEAGKPERILPKEIAESTAVIEDIAVSPFEDISIDTMVAYSAEEGTSYDQSDSYDQYVAFGLHFDATNSILYYQGQRVRVFTDEYPIDRNTAASIAHFDPAGTVDVQAQRDLTAIQYNPDGSYAPGGTLTGLRALSDTEFVSRDLTQWTSPASQITAVASSGSLTAAEQQMIYAPYAPYGLTYDATTDQLRYQGQLVRNFLDVQQSNGESFSGGMFKGSMTSMSYDFGDVDVTILRDYTRPDAQGDGAITGIDVQPAK